MRRGDRRQVEQRVDEGVTQEAGSVVSFQEELPGRGETALEEVRGGDEAARLAGEGGGQRRVALRLGGVRMTQQCLLHQAAEARPFPEVAGEGGKRDFRQASGRRRGVGRRRGRRQTR
ncbi:hypothetical protein KPH14_012647 [Odynerus spinipes]|uniref:Uncharacterized protein n=1 Tax=Odynerus spinipes TaxID=1348599 RepID=A0AAD9VLI4_9HYME|nr:hypothetical protein KPH14_012647 [Odynerus spinipes]